MNPTPVLFYREGTCALGALISLLWLGQPFHLVRMEDGDHENSDFLKLNALGEVPVFYRDGVVLTENIAILQFIGRLGLSKGLSFTPGSEDHDQLMRALSFLASDFHKSFGPVFHASSFHPDPEVQKEISRTVIKGTLHDVIKHAEIHLLRTPLMFEHPTVPDAYLFAMARWAENLYSLPKEFPHIARFQKTMKEDPLVKLALEIESGKDVERDQAFLGHLDFKTFVSEAAARKKQVDQDDFEEKAYPRSSKFLPK